MFTSTQPYYRLVSFKHPYFPVTLLTKDLTLGTNLTTNMESIMGFYVVQKAMTAQHHHIS